MINNDTSSHPKVFLHFFGNPTFLLICHQPNHCRPPAQKLHIVATPPTFFTSPSTLAISIQTYSLPLQLFPSISRPSQHDQEVPQGIPTTLLPHTLPTSQPQQSPDYAAACVIDNMVDVVLTSTTCSGLA
jgi:hypothetical protein